MTIRSNNCPHSYHVGVVNATSYISYKLPDLLSEAIKNFSLGMWKKYNGNMSNWKSNENYIKLWGWNPQGSLIPLLVSPACAHIPDKPRYLTYIFHGSLKLESVSFLQTEILDRAMYPYAYIDIPLCYVWLSLQNSFVGTYSPSSLEKLWST